VVEIEGDYRRRHCLAQHYQTEALRRSKPGSSTLI
jgi:hypothetical protein